MILSVKNNCPAIDVRIDADNPKKPLVYNDIILSVNGKDILTFRTSNYDIITTGDYADNCNQRVSYKSTIPVMLECVGITYQEISFYLDVPNESIGSTNTFVVIGIDMQAKTIDIN